jgi:hypothetical protein
MAYQRWFRTPLETHGAVIVWFGSPVDRISSSHDQIGQLICFAMRVCMPKLESQKISDTTSLLRQSMKLVDVVIGLQSKRIREGILVSDDVQR